jgi:hypothetical protein
MKNKKINFRVTEDFEEFLKIVSKLPRFKAKGIKSVSDFIRFCSIKTIRYEQGLKVLKNKKHIPEIKKYFYPF